MMLKKLPFSLSIVLTTLLWTLVASAIFGGSVILYRGDFDLVTRQTFIGVLAGVVGFFSMIVILEHASIIKFKGRDWALLNKNIENRHIVPEISDKDLLKVHYILENMNVWILRRYVFNTGVGLVIVGLFDWLIGHYLKNTLLIVVGGALAILWSIVGSSIFHELMTMSVRRECRILLGKRGIDFKETPFTSLSTKSKQFMVLLVMLVADILVLVPSLDAMTLVFSAVVLIIITLLFRALFQTIYIAFSEIGEAGKGLALGQKASFFSGSQDKEVVNLFGDLRTVAREIQEKSEALEESKAVLEIKVKSRTRELEELAQSLDEKVKQKTKELEEKLRELEKFQKFAIGRELKMLELKKQIKQFKRNE